MSLNLPSRITVYFIIIITGFSALCIGTPSLTILTYFFPTSSLYRVITLSLITSISIIPAGKKGVHTNVAS